jgi:6-pyruvoyl-tetrahydropterin synthase
MEPHPHQYRCEVGVSRPIGETDALVIDLAGLDRILDDEVVSRLEGKQLHREVPPFDRVPPTCEAIARDLYRRIGARLPAGVALDRVMVAEDENLRAECLGPS